MKILRLPGTLARHFVFTVAGLAMANAQTLYVSMNGTGTIKTVSSSGVVGGTAFATGLTAPKGVTFDSSGNLYVAEDKSGSLASVITKIDPSGNKSTYATGLQRPIDLVFDASGTLYIADYNSANNAANAIMKVAPGGGVATSFVTGSVLQSPFGLAFNSSGTLFVANRDNGSISQIDPSGNVSAFLPGGTFSQPNDITFDAAGHLYVASFDTGDISKVTGTTVSAYSNVTNAVGLAFDSVTGALFVASQGGSSIYEVPAGGGASTQFAYFGGDAPQYLAVAPSAIPEPGTSALVAGVIAVAFLGWNRRGRGLVIGRGM